MLVPPLSGGARWTSDPFEGAVELPLIPVLCVLPRRLLICRICAVKKLPTPYLRGTSDGRWVNLPRWPTVLLAQLRDLREYEEVAAR